MIRVLIVEDDPMVAELNRRYLACIPGFLLVAAVKTGDAALVILLKEKIDLVLLDVFMPGLSGLELLMEMRSQGITADVILLTAARDSHSINQALQYGAVDYLVKPFEFERFSAALANYKHRSKFIKSQGELDQHEIDQRVLFREPVHADQLPKGLDRKTLKKILEGIKERSGHEFTTEEMANQVGISRVSMRKYLEFLEKAGFLSLDISYGSIGRPVYKYQYTGKEYGV
ncbi:MAG: response regulator [Pelosinus sp.]|nr:response regulator [Pelosinus sp.]